ncbi:double zinc ribbon domain-containing protein [Halocatena pleomorpha]|uniref:CopG family transcriptional regulator n=1 Tax=Halocatena pleomorpha TaxID=1785090 RepID=A0A3P3R9S0_9EURY|nr:zinc ribbon domain-containing protein [Halocatena pleomorpha]RRJ30222.1 CopG family transcriptional regulator [Halocatena pleomorpha]
MSKITFRADDELIAQLEEFEASKSAIMREALRTYLNTHMSGSEPSDLPSEFEDERWVDHVIRDRVDELIGERGDEAFTRSKPKDINVNISVEGEPQTAVTDESSADPEQCKTPTSTTTDSATERTQCSNCGETHPETHVYCPNCGEKSTQNHVCECGADIDTKWSFCPACGRRTPTETDLERS